MKQQKCSIVEHYRDYTVLNNYCNIQCLLSGEVAQLSKLEIRAPLARTKIESWATMLLYFFKAVLRSLQTNASQESRRFGHPFQEVPHGIGNLEGEDVLAGMQQ